MRVMLFVPAGGGHDCDTKRSPLSGSVARPVAQESVARVRRTAPVAVLTSTTSPPEPQNWRARYKCCPSLLNASCDAQVPVGYGAAFRRFSLPAVPPDGPNL